MMLFMSHDSNNLIDLLNSIFKRKEIRNPPSIIRGDPKRHNEYEGLTLAEPFKIYHKQDGRYETARIVYYLTKRRTDEDSSLVPSIAYKDRDLIVSHLQVEKRCKFSMIIQSYYIEKIESQGEVKIIVDKDKYLGGYEDIDEEDYRRYKSKLSDRIMEEIRNPPDEIF